MDRAEIDRNLEEVPPAARLMRDPDDRVHIMNMFGTTWCADEVDEDEDDLGPTTENGLLMEELLSATREEVTDALLHDKMSLCQPCFNDTD